LSGLPDRRVLEGMMRQILGSQGRPGPQTPLEKAQEIMYQAFEEPDPSRQVQFARRALEISPDCADAHVLLAEHAHSRKEALEEYEKAVAAGERALGPEAFQEGVGHFWGILETRPYMRARLGLAESLWTVGRREEAVGHLQEMLRLNPNDNQGVRYTLAAWLLLMDRHDDLGRLLEKFPDEGSAIWAYTRALLAFRRQGDTPEARTLLQEARKSNKHVPAFLVGEKPLPAEPLDYYSPGDRSEAVMYARMFMGGWKETPGAVAWLRAAQPAAKKQPPAPPATGPLPLVKQRLQRLPQEYDVWQAGMRQLPSWVDEGGERYRPWAVLVISRESGIVLAHDLFPARPSPDQLWDILARAVQQPLEGDPHRPTEIQASPAEAWEALNLDLQDIDVDSDFSDELDPLDSVLDGLSEHMAEDEPPGLLDVPGITPEQVSRFYQAAAEFYRKAPWRSLGYEAVIKVECDRFESGPWYAIIMGQAGMTFGLTLYDDLRLLQKLFAGNASDEENARQTVALTVTFVDENELSPADLEAAEQHGWEVARPEAYPNLFRKERGMSMRPPLAWEMRLMEGCLRAVPGFVKKNPPVQPAREQVTVPTAGGELPLTLSWADIEGP
jgi:tetratricopeptide (TPR) repeat protein